MRTLNVERVEGILARLPTIPYAVDSDEIAAFTVDVNVSVLTYPAVPNPSTVDARLVFKRNEEIKSLDVMAVTVDANSVGSMKLLM